MSRQFGTGLSKILHPTTQLAFAVSACALAAACIGAIVNQWVEGWMAIGGMVGIGFFYAAIGIVNHLNSIPPDESNSNVSRRSASADNLCGEDVTTLRICDRTTPDVKTSDSHERSTDCTPKR
jgi:hypothetical protein